MNSKKKKQNILKKTATNRNKSASLIVSVFNFLSILIDSGKTKWVDITDSTVDVKQVEETRDEGIQFVNKNKRREKEERSQSRLI